MFGILAWDFVCLFYYKMCFAHKVTEHEEGLEEPRKICPLLWGLY